MAERLVPDPPQGAGPRFPPLAPFSRKRWLVGLSYAGRFLLGRSTVCGVLLLLVSCTPLRTLEVRSDPAGATVQLDGNTIGRTPLVVPFEHHGTRRVTLYLEGYLVWSEAFPMPAPWWAGFPFDLVTDHLIPWRLEDAHKLEVALTPSADRPGVSGIEAFLEQAEALRASERVMASEPDDGEDPR